MRDDVWVLGDVQQLGEDVAKLAATSLWPLPDDEITACLQAAHRLEQAAAALQGRLVQQAETRGLPAAQGHRTTAAWLRARLLLDPTPAKEIADRATVLSRQREIEEVLLDGQVDARQAAVIATASETVAAGLAEFDEVGPAEAREIVQLTQTTMIEMAGRLPAFQLQRVGQRILAHVAPHLAERADQLLLARQEARAHEARGFTVSLPADGMVRLSGTLGTDDAAVLQAALQPLTKPGPTDERRPAQRRADALIDVCRLALSTGDLPETGGEPAQLAVTVAYDPLTKALSAATTDSGTPVSPATARRLACDARILPVVLGSAGQVLDIGRTQRLATGPLRRALAVRDGGCAFPDCDRPPKWTDAHHMIAWTAGGATALHNLVLLCRRHHRVIHHPTAGWQIRLGPDGLPDFIPPPDIDPGRHPRRNLYRLRANVPPAAVPSPRRWFQAA